MIDPSETEQLRAAAQTLNETKKRLFADLDRIAKATRKDIAEINECLELISSRLEESV